MYNVLNIHRRNMNVYLSDHLRKNIRYTYDSVFGNAER